MPGNEPCLVNGEQGYGYRVRIEAREVWDWQGDVLPELGSGWDVETIEPGDVAK